MHMSCEVDGHAAKVPPNGWNALGFSCGLCRPEAQTGTGDWHSLNESG